jgi:cytochrome P450
MYRIDHAPPRVVVDGLTLGRLGMLKVAERALRDARGMVTLDLPGGRAVTLLARPAHAAFWQDNPGLFHKDVDHPGTGAALTRDVLGKTLLTARDGAEWQQMRAELTGLLGQSKAWFRRPLAAATGALADRLVRDADTPLLDQCIAWAMQAICDPLFAAPQWDKAAHDLVLALNDGFLARLEGAALPDGLQGRYAALMARIGQDRGANSVADVVMQEGASEAQLQSIVGGMLAGSLHINALSLFWMLVQVAGDAGLQDRIAAESRGNDTGRAVDTPLAFATVREAQRLRPVMAFIERQMAADTVLDGYTLRAGDTVLFSPWFAQRDAEVWDDPLQFDPARFGPGARHAKGAAFPFGLGPRMCPGMNLVNQQLTFALSRLCRSARFSLAADTRPGDLGCMFRVNLEPRGPVRLVLTRRTPFQSFTKGDRHAVDAL